MSGLLMGMNKESIVSMTVSYSDVMGAQIKNSGVFDAEECWGSSLFENFLSPNSPVETISSEEDEVQEDDFEAVEDGGEFLELFSSVDSKLNIAAQSLKERYDTELLVNKKIESRISVLRKKNPGLLYWYLATLYDKYELPDSDVFIKTLDSMALQPTVSYRKIPDLTIELPLYDKTKPLESWRKTVVLRVYKRFSDYVQKNYSSEHGKKLIKLVQLYGRLFCSLPYRLFVRYIDRSEGLRFMEDKVSKKMILSLYVQDKRTLEKKESRLGDGFSKQQDLFSDFLAQECKAMHLLFPVKPLLVLERRGRIMCNRKRSAYSKDFIVPCCSGNSTGLRAQFLKRALIGINSGLAILVKTAKKHRSRLEVMRIQLMQHLIKFVEKSPTVLFNYFSGISPFMTGGAIGFVYFSGDGKFLHPQFYAQKGGSDPIEAFFRQALEEMAVLYSQKKLEPKNSKKGDAEGVPFPFNYAEYSGLNRKWVDPREL